MKNMSNNPSEPCQICGDIGFKDFIMTCFNCMEVREHSYCAIDCSQSPPDMWLCQVCTSSNLVDKDMKALTTDHGASSSETSTKLSGSPFASPSKKHRPQFLAFPSPKRKCRTPRVPVDIEEAHDEGPGSSYSRVFHQIDCDTVNFS